jgi:hypothetical protein
VDVTALGALAAVTYVGLADNLITDLTPLAQNLELDIADVIELQSNSIDCTAQAANIATLEGRGVQLYTDCP